MVGFNIRPMGFWRQLYHRDSGFIAKLLCLLGRHDWDVNCNGWTGDEWLVCRRCLRERLGSFREWNGKERRLMPSEIGWEVMYDGRTN